MDHGALYGKSMIPNEIMNILNENTYLHRNNSCVLLNQPFMGSSNRYPSRALHVPQWNEWSNLGAGLTVRYSCYLKGMVIMFFLGILRQHPSILNLHMEYGCYLKGRAVAIFLGSSR